MAQAAESYLSEMQRTAAEDGLADAEIARLLKSVQAAQFKKSESLIPETDGSFKPRSLVEIAFEAEKKRQEEAAQKEAHKTAQKAAEQAAMEQAGPKVGPEVGQETAEQVMADTSLQGHASQAVAENPNLPKAGQLLDAGLSAGSDNAIADQIQQEQAQEAAAEEARLQREAEDANLRTAADKEGYKRGFEAGLEAVRSAEPTEEEKAIAAMREQERKDMIARLEAVIASAASADAVDISALAPALEQAVLKLASERAGLAIGENPEGLVQRIEALIEKVKSGANAITITLNPDDLTAVEAWQGTQNTHPNWNWRGDASFVSGDIRLKLDGITVTDLLGVENIIAPASKIEPEEDQPAEVAASEVDLKEDQLEEDRPEEDQPLEVAASEVDLKEDQLEEDRPEAAQPEAANPEERSFEENSAKAPEVTPEATPEDGKSE